MALESVGPVDSVSSIDPASFYLREALRLRELAKFFVYPQTRAEVLAMAERYELLAAHATARHQIDEAGVVAA